MMSISLFLLASVMAYFLAAFIAYSIYRFRWFPQTQQAKSMLLTTIVDLRLTCRGLGAALVCCVGMWIYAEFLAKDPCRPIACFDLPGFSNTEVSFFLTLFIFTAISLSIELHRRVKEWKEAFFGVKT